MYPKISETADMLIAAALKLFLQYYTSQTLLIYVSREGGGVNTKYNGRGGHPSTEYNFCRTIE